MLAMNVLSFGHLEIVMIQSPFLAMTWKSIQRVQGLQMIFFQIYSYHWHFDECESRKIWQRIGNNWQIDRVQATTF